MDGRSRRLNRGGWTALVLGVLLVTTVDRSPVPLFLAATVAGAGVWAIYSSGRFWTG